MIYEAVYFYVKLYIIHLLFLVCLFREATHITASCYSTVGTISRGHPLHADVAVTNWSVRAASYYGCKACREVPPWSD